MRSLAGPVLLSVVLAGCTGSSQRDAAVDATIDATSSMDAPAETTVRDAAPEAATEMYPSKGPWVMRVNPTGASVFWESHTMHANIAVNVAPEAGGPMQTLTGVAEAYDVMTGYGVGNRLIGTPDVPGIYYINRVDVTGLTPATCYRYQIVDTTNTSGRFCTMHDPLDHTTPIRFMVIGDTNPVLGDTIPVLNAVLPRNPEFVVHMGDLQYYSSVTETWQVWFQLMPPMLRQGAILPCVGNHENELDGSEFVDYYSRFFDTPEPDGETRWYHYQTGGVHFFSLDTEEDLSQGSTQWNWLSGELDAASASDGFRFSILYFHRPPYTLGDVAPRLDLRTALAPLLSSHVVPLILNGHMHGYERFEVPPQTFIVSGGGGGIIGNVDQGVPMYPADVPLRVASGAFFHAMIFTVQGTTLHGDAIDESGTTRDTFDIPVPQ